MSLFRKAHKSPPADLWLKCPACREMLLRSALQAAARVCPLCGHTFPLPLDERIALLADPSSFEEWHPSISSIDFLAFPGHQQRLDEARSRTSRPDALLAGRASILGRPVAIAAFDSAFLDASLGSAAAESFARAASRAASLRLPFLAVASASAPRLAEGALALLQPAKIVAALALLSRARLPFLALLAAPAPAAPPAFFALADLVLAEPGAAPAPPPDQIVPRHLLRDRLSSLLALLCGPIPSP